MYFHLCGNSLGKTHLHLCGFVGRTSGHTMIEGVKLNCERLQISSVFSGFEFAIIIRCQCHLWQAAKRIIANLKVRRIAFSRSTAVTVAMANPRCLWVVCMQKRANCISQCIFHCPVIQHEQQLEKLQLLAFRLSVGSCCMVGESWLLSGQWQVTRSVRKWGKWKSTEKRSVNRSEISTSCGAYCDLVSNICSLNSVLCHMATGKTDCVYIF